jgi:hypothetical protein
MRSALSEFADGHDLHPKGAPGASPAADHTAERGKKDFARRPQFPRKELFEKPVDLPGALLIYRRWAEANQIPMEVALADLSVYLPSSIQNLRMVPSSGPTSNADGPFPSWDEAEKVLIRQAGQVVGTRAITQTLEGLRIEPGDRVVDRYVEILHLCRMRMPETTPYHEALQVLINKLPPAVGARIGSSLRSSQDYQAILIQLQSEFDAVTCDSNKFLAAVSPAEAKLELSIGGTPVPFRFDTGADVSFVGARTSLGRLFEKQARPASSEQYASTPGGRTKILWTTRIQVEAQFAGRNNTRTAQLQLEVQGVEDYTGNILYIGLPAMQEWGVVVDTASNRFGVKSLSTANSGPTPWFPLPVESSRQAQSVPEPQGRFNPSPKPDRKDWRREKKENFRGNGQRGNKEKPKPQWQTQKKWRLPGPGPAANPRGGDGQAPPQTNNQGGETQQKKKFGNRNGKRSRSE